jgi:L-2,4-diaminobutyrate transaminase
VTADPAHNLSLDQLDQRSFFHPKTDLAAHIETGPVVMKHATGVTVTDTTGRSFVDAMAGLACVNIGWGRHEVADAAYAQMKELAYYHSFASMGNAPAIKLADRLTRIAPGEMSKVFFGNSGSDANDTLVKFVWCYNNLKGRPEKKKIIARRQGYHGVTVAAGSLTGIPSYHAAFDLPMGPFLHTSQPHYFWRDDLSMSEEDYSAVLAAELDALIVAEGPETVAAFIAEPAMGGGGMIPPPAGYFAAVQRVLRKHDVLFLADEVITGFGRLGTMFGCEQFGIEPDMVSIAKGLTSAYLPLSGAMVSDEIWQTFVAGSEQMGSFTHGYTYSGHPVAAAAALANLDILEGEGLVENAERMGRYLRHGLEQSLGNHPLVGEIRGLGLLNGVELVADRAERRPLRMEQGVGVRLAALCMEEGLLTRPLDVPATTALTPPLCITEGECDELVRGYTSAVHRLHDELGRDGTV